jgi:hypothetical protein
MSERPSEIPRRWNVEVDGIRWLPRMIDKARMSAAGKLGRYLLGHSPVDRALLARLELTTEQFAALAVAGSDDLAILEALRGRGFDEARVRRWSDRFATSYRTYVRLWDVDEGFVAPTPLERVALAVVRPFEGLLMGAVRKVVPRP